jgi:hypothetical protein
VCASAISCVRSYICVFAWERDGERESKEGPESRFELSLSPFYSLSLARALSLARSLSFSLSLARFSLAHSHTHSLS